MENDFFGTFRVHFVGFFQSKKPFEAKCENQFFQTKFTFKTKNMIEKSLTKYAKTEEFVPQKHSENVSSIEKYLETGTNTMLAFC